MIGTWFASIAGRRPFAVTPPPARPVEQGREPPHPVSTSQPLRHARRRRPGRRPRRWGWLLLVAGLLVVVGWGAVTVIQLYRHARSLQSHLHELESLAGGDAGDLDLAGLAEAGPHLTGLRRDLEAIQVHIGPLLPAGRLLSWLPTYGGDLTAAQDLLDLALSVASAGDRTFQALSPALDRLTDSTGEDSSLLSAGEQLLPVLETAGPELRAAQAELAAADQARARLDAASLSPRVAGLVERLDRYLPWFQVAVDGALLAPDLLGAGGPRTYLLLAQNNQELRPTGGFISGVGELRLDRGQILSLAFEDSYAVDNLQVPHEVAPPDFQKTLLGDLIFFRDANWDADFPTSARRAIEIYARDRGFRADGAIALDLTALRLLVAAAGPLQVEGLDQPVTGQNVLAVLQQQWAGPAGGQGAEWWLHRKDFMGQITAALLKRLTAARDVQPADLAWALKQALDEKHILLYVEDAGAARLLRDRNWAGALPRPGDASDFLLVVDTNVGFNKVDPNIDRAIEYRVDLSRPQAPLAHLTLRYRHRSARPVGACIQEARYDDAYADMMERCYWDYVRVHVPPGARLRQGPDLSLPAGSLLARQGQASDPSPPNPILVVDGRSIWTAFFDLPTLEERSLVWIYELPDGVVERDATGLFRYRLRVQKQPGTEAVPLRLEIQLPPGAQLAEVQPEGLPALDTDLRHDQDVSILFRLQGENP
ncbi:MAG: DUF4012 domain-containing protein [Anaerolineae bacterium]